MTDRLIAIIPKNATEELRVAITEYGGHTLIAARVYFDPRDGTGQKRPGKAGLNIRVDTARDLVSALQKAIDEVGA